MPVAPPRSPARLNAPFALVLLALLGAACSSGGSTNTGFAWPDSSGTGVVILPDGGTATADTGGGGDTVGGSETSGDDSAGGADATDEPEVEVPDGPPCAKASACKGFDATPYCDLTVQVCVECITDAHCSKSTGYCKKNKCVDPSCVPGSSECQGNFLATCKPDGKGYDLAACPDSAPACYGGACVLCQPGTIDCAPPATPGGPSAAVRKCQPDGLSADIVEVCPAGQTCFAGTCGVCTPSAKRCTNHLSEECNADGTAWVIAKDCSANGLTCLGGLCVNPCDGDFKSNTNVGCDYWAVDLDNAVDSGGGQIYDAQNAQFSLIVSNTANAEALVTVTLGADPKAAGAKSKQWTVPAKGLQVINLPDKSWGVPNQNQDGSNVNNRVYRVQATQPIVAYQFNPLQNYGVFSNDASLLLPTGSLGQEYWIVSRNQLGTKFRSYFNVIATMPGKTEVTVVVSAPTIAGVGVAKMSLGSKITFSLDQGQALNVESDQEDADLTGSWVSADKPVAVFGGSEASNSPQIGSCVPKTKGSASKVCAGSTLGLQPGTPCAKDADCDSACCADHLEEQLFPTKSWGTSYVGARLSPRGKELDAWRIVASTNGTTVKIQPNIGINVPVLNQGQFFEFQTTADFLLESDKPVLLAQYMASSYATITTETTTCTTDASCKQTYGFEAKCDSAGFSNYCAPIGDPSLILDVATTQYLDDYIFLVPDKYKLNFITIIAPLGATVNLDGSNLLSSGFNVVPGTNWTVARLPIAAGKHALSSNQKVGLFVYGYDDDVSYGYPGGAGL